MSDIKFSADQKAQITDSLRTYLREEFELDVGQFEAEFLLDFISRELGAVYYNRGLADAQTQISTRVDNILEAIDELAQPTNIDR